jgi:hypothetical protein
MKDKACVEGRLTPPMRAERINPDKATTASLHFIEVDKGMA